VDAKLYFFPSHAVRNDATPGTVSLDGVELLPTEESMRAVSVALEAINRDLDQALAMAEDSLLRINNVKCRACERIQENKQRVLHAPQFRPDPA